MKIGLAQTDILWNDPEGNLPACRRMVEAAKKQSVDLLIFPEMFLCGFSFLKGDAATNVWQVGEKFLLEQSRLEQMYICGSLPDLREPGLPKNTLLLTGPDGVLGTYSKQKLFEYAGEDKHYGAGEIGFLVNIAGMSVAFLICYDLRFPELFLEHSDADVFVVVANWPAARAAHFEKLLYARAIDYQAYVVGVNRVGTGDGVEYLGRSIVVSPEGDLLAKCGETEELQALVLEKDAAKQARLRFPIKR